MGAQDFNIETLTDAVRCFSDPEKCERFVEQMRWPEGVECPYCESKNIGRITSRHAYQCRDCRTQFTVKIGTIFEDSPLSLDKWLIAMWLESNCRNGASSCEVARHIGVTQKTAWHMLHRMRFALQDKQDGGKPEGEVEVDETLIGGKARNMHKSRRDKTTKGGTRSSGKTGVMGMLERNGKVRTEDIQNTRRKNLDPRVRKNVEAGSCLHTDALPSHESLQDEYLPAVVDHSRRYVEGARPRDGRCGRQSRTASH